MHTVIKLNLYTSNTFYQQKHLQESINFRTSCICRPINFFSYVLCPLGNWQVYLLISMHQKTNLQLVDVTTEIVCGADTFNFQ